MAAHDAAMAPGNNAGPWHPAERAHHMVRYVVLAVMGLGLIGMLIGLGDPKLLVPGTILLGAGTISLAIGGRA